METTPRPTATQRPGPSLAKADFRRESSPLRVWTPTLAATNQPPTTELEDRVIAEVEESLRDAARRLREVRCLIDRLGAIPIVGSDE